MGIIVPPAEGEPFEFTITPQGNIIFSNGTEYTEKLVFRRGNKTNGDAMKITRGFLLSVENIKYW